MARTIIGTVVSDKPDKTIVLSVTERKTHPLYKKQYSRSTKYIAHDEKNDAKVGDKVKVAETKPISKRKTLTLVSIIDRAKISSDKTVEAITSQDEGSETTIQEKKEAEKEAKITEKESESLKEMKTQQKAEDK